MFTRVSSGEWAKGPLQTRLHRDTAHPFTTVTTVLWSIPVEAVSKQTATDLRKLMVVTEVKETCHWI
jgi:hypothetical protein